MVIITLKELDNMGKKINNLKDYSAKLTSAISTIKEELLDDLFKELYNRIDSSSNIYIIGNGGSLANAEHIAGDYLKTLTVNKKRLNISCPGSNLCYVTAISNDLSYEDSYCVLINSLITNGDLLIYLSGSGNSMNLVKCARKAKRKNIKQVSITAFNGGALSDIVDIPIVVEIDDMEIAEDCQLILFHYLKQRILKSIVTDESTITMPKYVKRTLDDLVS